MLILIHQNYYRYCHFLGGGGGHAVCRLYISYELRHSIYFEIFYAVIFLSFPMYLKTNLSRNPWDKSQHRRFQSKSRREALLKI